MDGILITGSSQSSINATKEMFRTYFKLKDLGNAKYFLRLELLRSNQGIYLSQRKHCVQIIEYTKCSINCWEFEELLNEEYASLFRRMIGWLLYLQILRPYICFTIHKLSQCSIGPPWRWAPFGKIYERKCRTRHCNSAYYQISIKGL